MDITFFCMRRHRNPRCISGGLTYSFVWFRTTNGRYSEFTSCDVQNKSILQHWGVKAEWGGIVLCHRFRHTISHQLDLESVYKHILPGFGNPEITTLHSEGGATVDYIFYSPRRISTCGPNGMRTWHKSKCCGCEWIFYGSNVLVLDVFSFFLGRRL